MKKKNPQPESEAAIIARTRRTAEAFNRRHPRKGIVHMQKGDLITGFGGFVKPEYLANGLPAAVCRVDMTERSGAKMIRLVANLARAFPKQVGEPIITTGLRKLTPAVVGCVRNLENAAAILSERDPDYSAVRRLFTNIRTGRSTKAIRSSVTDAVSQAMHAGTKAVTTEVAIPPANAEEGVLELADLGRVVTGAAFFGAKLGEDVLASDAGQSALINFVAGIISELVAERSIAGADQVKGFSKLLAASATVGSKMGAAMLASPEGQVSLSRFASEYLKALTDEPDDAA